MNTSDSEPYKFTPAQLERQKQLDRFNRLTIYLPLGILALAIITVTGLLFWLTLFNDAEAITEWRSFSSATADLIIILTILPIMLFVALIPILAAGWLWYTWQSPRPVESWLQKWLRRTDDFVVNSAEKVNATSKKAADLSIKYRSGTTRVGRIIERCQQAVFTRKEHKN